MKTAIIEILDRKEIIFGTRTAGEYFVREYEDEIEMGGEFFKTIEEAEAHVREYQRVGHYDPLTYQNDREACEV